MEQERAWQSVGAGASVVGVAAVLSPTLLGRVFGLTEPTTGGGSLAWRLFGVRTALIGVATVRGSAQARRAVLPVQAADQLVFLHALPTGSVPRRTALMAMATSGALITGCLAGRSPRHG